MGWHRCAARATIDRSIAFFTSSAAAPGFDDLSEVGCARPWSEVRIAAGQTYFVQVRQAPGPIEGSWDVIAELSNDSFADAHPLAPVDGSVVTISGSWGIASREPGEPQASCGSDVDTVWFSWSPAFDGRATLKVEQPRRRFGLFTSSVTSPELSELDELGCTSTELTFDVESGVTYWLSSEAGTSWATIERVPEPPTNDDLAGAAEVGWPPGAILRLEGSAAGATVEPGEPVHSCGSSEQTIWYRWTPNSSGEVAMELRQGRSAAVYRSDLGAPGHADLQLVDCVDGGIADFSVTAAESYWVQADASDGSIVTITAVERPANDDFVDAMTIGPTDGRTVIASSDGRYATAEIDEPTECEGSRNSVWFRWDPEFTGPVELSSHPFAWTSQVAVYRSPADQTATLDDLTLVRCGGGGFDVVDGVTYWFQVAGDQSLAARLARPEAGLPSNDHLVEAWELETTDGSAATIGDNLAGMSVEADEPTPSCAPSLPAISATRWYRWTPDSEGWAALSTIAGYVAVYGAPADSSNFADLTEVACSLGSFEVEPDRTYYVQAAQVHTIGSEFLATLGERATPTNDGVSEAIDYGTIGGPFGISGDATWATADEGEPLDTCRSDSKPAIWYRWSPERSGLVAMANEDYRSVGLQMFTSDLDQPTYGDLIAVGCERDAIEVDAGADYWIAVSGRDFEVGVRFVERPPHDDLANAQRVETSDGGAAAIMTNTEFATLEADESESICGKPVVGTIWYEWTPQSNGWADLTSDRDQFAVLTSDRTPATHESLTELACASRFGQLGWSFEAGRTYYIVYAGWTGSIGRSMRLVPHPAPANDDLAGAVVESITDGVPFRVEGSTFAASGQPTEPFECARAEGERATVWFRWTPEFGEVIDLDWRRQGIAAVYSSTSDRPSFDELQFVGCVEPAGSQVVASAGTTYWFQVSGLPRQSAGFDLLARPTALLDTWGEEAVRSLPADVAGFSGTIEIDEPSPSCATGAVSSAWFVWTSDTDGEVVLDPSGSSPGVAVALYTGPGRTEDTGLADGLTETACIVAPIDRVVNVDQGVRYWVQLAAPETPADLALRVRPISAKGDRPHGASGPIDVPSGGGELAFDASTASYELTEMPTACRAAAFGNSVWLHWIPASNEVFELLVNGAVEVSIDGAKPVCAPDTLDAASGDRFVFRFDAPPSDARLSRFTLRPICDDGDATTADRFDLDAESCEYVLIEGAVCDDGNQATDNDMIVGGGCSGSPIDCDDGDPYTADIADSDQGCVYVEGDRPPTLVAPPDIVAAWSERITRNDIGAPSVSDDSGIDPTVENDAPFLFPVGVTVVTWTATDAAGNVSVASQQVTIEAGPATIRGRVWHDADYDGLRDVDEVGRRLVVVTLRGPDGVIASREVDPDGTYTFDGLQPFRTYGLQFSASGLWYFVDPDVGDDESIDSDILTADAMRQQAGTSVFVRPESVTVIDAGVTRSLSVVTTVFHDLDGDGVRDQGEGAFPTSEVVVEIVDESGVVVRRMPGADAVAGVHRADLLRPGTYTMRMLTWTNRTITTPHRFGSISVDEDGTVATSGPFTLGDSRLGRFFDVGVRASEYRLELATPTLPGVAESGGTIMLPVVFGAALGEVELTIQVADTSEFAVGDRFVVPPGITLVTVPITVVDDDIVDGNVAVPITISALGGGYSGQSITLTLVNFDDDSAGVLVEPVSGLQTSESGENANFQVVLESAPTRDVTIPLSVSDPTEGSIDVSELVFTRDNWDQPQTVTVTGRDDALDDGDVVYLVRLGVVTGDLGAWIGLDPPDVEVTNLDDDESTVAGVLWFDDGDGIRQAGERAYAGAAVRLVDDAGTTVAWTVSADGTYRFVAPAPGTYRLLVDFLAPFTNPFVDVPTVPNAGDDDTIDSDVAGSIAADAESAPFQLGTGIVIDDLDIGVLRMLSDASLSVSPRTGLVTGESGASDSFTVVLDRAPTGDVVIPLTVSDATEVTIDRFSLVFTVDDWDQPQAVTVTGVDDSVLDGDQTFDVRVGTATGGGYTGIIGGVVNGTNTDDDEASDETAPLLVPPADVMMEATGPSMSVELGSATAIDDRDLNPSVFNDAPARFPVGSTTVTWTAVDDAGNRSTATQTVQIDDTTAPSITAPADVVVDQGELVALGAPVVVDLVDSTPLISTDAPELFPLGTTIVTWKAIDSSGNIGTAQQRVDVLVPAGLTVDVIGDPVVTEGGTFVDVSISLDRAPTGPVLIPLSISDATEAAVDPGVIVWDGSWTVVRHVRVTGLDDAENDGDVDFQLQIGPPVGGGYDAVEAVTVGFTTIDDDVADGDPPTIVAPEDVRVLFGQPVVLGLPFVSDVGDSSPTVDNDAPATFPAGLTTVTWTATDASGNRSTDTQEVIVIEPTVAVTPTSGLRTSEAGGDASFTIALGAAPIGDVTINVRTTDPSEARVGAVATVGVDLVFTVDNWDQPRTVTVEGVDDAVDDGDVAFVIVVGVASGGGYDGVDPTDVSGTNGDDDEPTGSLAGRVWSDIDGDGVQDSGEPGLSGVRVDLGYGLGNFTFGTETTGLDGSYEFTGLVSGVYAVRVTVPVGYSVSPAGVGVDETVDSDFDAGGVARLLVVSEESTTGGVDAGLVPDPSPGVTVTPTSGLETSEGGGTISFSVVLDTQPTGTVTIAISSTDTGEGTLGVTELQFLPANWDQPQYVTVTGVDDADDDGDVLYTVLLDAAFGGGYDGVDPIDVLVINIDDDSSAASGSISGHSWLDLDFSDSRSAGDIPASGVTIRLLDSSLTEIASTTTSAAGTYSFSGLAAGTYYIGVGENPGFWPIVEDGAPDEVDNDIFWSTRMTEAIVIAHGQHVANVDAGWSGDF